MRKYGKITAGVLITIALTQGCSNGGGSGTTASLSGSLSSLQSFEPLKGRRGFQLQSGDASKVACATASNPPTVVTSDIGAGGSFSIDLSTVAGQPLTCTVLDASNEIVGTFLFQNSSQKGFGGSAQQADTVAIEGSKDVGVVSINGSQITVDAASLGISTTGQSLSAAEAFDPTGTWALGNVDFTLPAGYVGPCDPSDTGCHGPTAGESIYIKRVVGKNFTPDNTCQAAADAKTFTSSDSCAGTTRSEDAFVFAIWMSENTFKHCGNGTTGALGFTEGEAKAYGHIDFSADSSTLHQAYNYSTLSGHLTEGWKDDRATAAWEISSCGSIDLGGSPAWRCTDGAGHYSIGVGGGCTDSNGNPYQPANWATMDWMNSTGCTNQTVTIGGYSLNSNSCSVTDTSNSNVYTCGGTWGAFTQAGGSPANTDAVYMGSFTNQALVAQGNRCDGSQDSWTPTGNAEQLAQLQCYANYYYQNVSQLARTDDSLCLREVRMDWSATDPANFVVKDGPGRPVNQALVEKVSYLSSNVAAMTQIEDEHRGIQITTSNGSSWVDCKTVAKSSITMTKIDSTHMVIKFITETHLSDDKTACKAAASDPTSSAYSQLGLGTSRMLFRMTKQ